MGEKPTQVETVRLGRYELQVATSAGPRVTGLRHHTGSQLFAWLPGLTLEQPGLADYTLIGGHRLWRAPEIPEITYRPDNTPVTIERNDETLVVTGSPEPDGMRKELRLWASDRYLVVDHLLTNEGAEKLWGASWAITQMRTGGCALLPQHLGLADELGLQPNRTVVLWPYTDPGADEFSWGREAVLIDGSSNPVAMKIGQPNQRGWIGYAYRDELFVKWAAVSDPNGPDSDGPDSDGPDSDGPDSEGPDSDGPEASEDDGPGSYLDFGASVQVYRNEHFVELETMGPVADIDPGSTMFHREVWRVIPLHTSGVDLVEAVADIDLPTTPPPMAVAPVALS